MQIKKNFSLLVVLLAFCLALTGCSHTKSYTFKLGNGEKIEVELQTKKKRTLKQKDGIFAVKENKDTVLSGCFVTSIDMERYIGIAKATATVIKDEPTEFFYSLEAKDHTEHVRIIPIPHSEYGVLLATTYGEDVANEIYKELSFKVVTGEKQGENTLPGVTEPSANNTSAPEQTSQTTEPQNPTSDTTEAQQKMEVEIPVSETPQVSSPENAVDTTPGYQEAYDEIMNWIKYDGVSKEYLLSMYKYSADDIPNATSEDWENALENIEKEGKVNWKEEAVEKAKSYLKTDETYTKERLKDQLTSEYGEMFTEEEAEYAINQVFTD